MSLWRRIRERIGGTSAPSERVDPLPESEPAAAPPPAKPTAPGVLPDALEPLVQLAAGGEATDELALSALARAKGGSSERRALELVLRAHAAGRASEELSTRAAELYFARGQTDRAIELVSGASSVPALLLAADLHAERRELGRALTLVERVLARDIDAPGARERHERWRRELGASSVAVAALDQPTVLRADAPETALRIVGEAGRGGAGSVYEAIDDALGRRVALKVYHRPDEERDKLECEARAAVRFAGPGVIRIFDVDVERGFIVAEWLPGRALKYWIGRGDHGVLRPIERWLAPLVQTLARIHAAGAVHGDLKPANVLFRSVEQPVLTDFGLARDRGESLAGGSLGYMSPERIEQGVAEPSDDVYAIGRLLEDALQALGKSDAAWGGSDEASRFLALARRLLADRGERPPDAAAVSRLLEQT